MQEDRKDVGTLLQSREGFQVKRYHTIYHHIPETVGHHTCNVLSILFFLYKNDPPIKVLHNALHHDVTELYTGDIPAPAKWRFDNLHIAVVEAESAVAQEMGLADHDIAKHDAAMIQFADMMDLCLKSIEELACGNTPFQVVLVNGMRYCKRLLMTELSNEPRAEGLFEMLFKHPHVQVEEVQSKFTETVQ